MSSGLRCPSSVTARVREVSTRAARERAVRRGCPLLIRVVAVALGSAAFGIATYRGSVLSRKGPLSLAIGPAVGFIGAVAVGQDLWGLGMPLVLVGIVSFLAGWFTHGVAAIRLDRTTALKPA